jgi:hypothetical protein
MQISSALTDLVPELIKFSANRDQRQNQQSILDARVTRAQNATTFRDAVNSGKISADQNPWFIKTWKEMDGSVAADRYNEDLLLATSTGPLANSTSQEESNKLLDNFKSNWIKANLQSQDGDFVAGFQAKSAGYDQNIRAHQAATVGNNIVAAAGDTFDQNIQGIIGESYTRGIDAPTVAEGINHEADKFLLAGGSKADVNKMILKAVAQDGKDNFDVSHAKAILDNIKTGPGGFLSGTTDAKTVMAAVEDHVTNALHQQDSWAYTEQEHKRQAVIQNASSSVGQALIQNAIDHKPVLLEDFKTQIDAVYASGGWEMAQNLQKAILKSQNDPESEETQIKDNLYTAVLGSEALIDFDRLNRERSAGTISLKTYVDLMEKTNERIRQNKADNKEPSFFKNESYKIQGDDMDRFLGKDDAIFDATKELNRGQADAQFWTQIYRWDQEHPKATHDEQIEYATKVGDRLKEQFRGPDLKLGGTIQSNLQRSPGISSGAVNQIGAPVPEQDFKNLQDFHNALDEATKNPKGQTRIAIKAAEHGMTPLEYAKQQSQFYPEEPSTPSK